MLDRTAEYKLNNTTFRVSYGDITQLSAGALASSDDNYLSMSGGVSKAISKAGGDAISRDARKHIPLGLGDVVVTSAGRLPAKYIFHVVAIDLDRSIYIDGDGVNGATLKCMQLADVLDIRHIAFPALATGSAKFPFQKAAETMTRTIADYSMGKTRIELVTLILFARRGIDESDLNLFYERAVALASVSTQSKKLIQVLAELKGAVERIQQPELTKHFAELQSELMRTQISLTDVPTDLEHLEQLQMRSNINQISQKVVDFSTRTQEAVAWDDRRLEAEIMNTKLNGFLTQLNIHYANLNKLQIKKAKYGPLDTPLPLENAIEELQEEIERMEVQIKETRLQLAALNA